MGGIRFLAALVFAGLLCAGTTEAMEIRQFDRMADPDPSEHLGAMIVAKPRGAFAMQKQPANASVKTPAAKAGLTIPPQRVVPLAARGR